MKIKALVGIVALVSMVICADAQVEINWFNEETSPDSGVYKKAIDPISGLFVMSSITNPLAGALFQLIQAAGASPIAPTAEFGGGTGVTSDDVLNMWAWAGKGDYGDGLVYEKADNFSGTRSFYVRIWDQPTSGRGNMPNAFHYGSGQDGGYYYDTAIQTFAGTAGSPSIANFAFTPPTEFSDWTFLPIPEPGSMALGLIGLGVILIRRRLMRK